MKNNTNVLSCLKVFFTESQVVPLYEVKGDHVT